MEIILRSLIIGLICMLSACFYTEEQSISDKNQTAFLRTTVDTNLINDMSKKRSGKTSKINTIDSSVTDIDKVTIRATLINDASQSFTIELSESEGVYSAILELLIGQQYELTANAYISDEVSYSGTTFQTIANGEAINITLNHISSGSNNTIPQINQIIRNDLIEQKKSAKIGFKITGSFGERLSYELSSEAGTFTPSNGFILLPPSSNSATIIVTYLAPASDEAVELNNSFKLTNSQNNTVITNFITNIVPALNSSNYLSLSYNPVIKGVSVLRESTQLAWSLSVDTIGDEHNLQYFWDFDPSAGSSLFAIEDTNPGIMDGYNNESSGRVTVTVTDSSINGGSTTYNYELNAGIFPNIINSEPSIEEKVTIDFSPATLPNGSRCENDPFIREGFLFTPITRCSFGISNHDGTGNAWLSLLANAAGSTLKAANNAPFTLYSIDLGEYSTVYDHPQTLQVTCIKNGASTLINIDIDGVITDSNDKFQTFDLEAECSDINEFRFGSLMSVDNIILSTP